MATAKLQPLSATVDSVFAKFLKGIEDDELLNKAALEALSKALSEQKLDADSLGQAIFAVDEPKS